MKAVQWDGLALQYASAELKGHRGVTMEAVKQNGGALRYALHEAKAEKYMKLLAAEQLNQAEQASKHITSSAEGGHVTPKRRRGSSDQNKGSPRPKKKSKSRRQ